MAGSTSMNPLLAAELMIPEWRSTRQRIGLQLVALRHRIEQYPGRLTLRQRAEVEREIALLSECAGMLARSQYAEREEIDDRTLRILAEVE